MSSAAVAKISLFSSKPRRQANNGWKWRTTGRGRKSRKFSLALAQRLAVVQYVERERERGGAKKGHALLTISETDSQFVDPGGLYHVTEVKQGGYVLRANPHNDVVIVSVVLNHCSWEGGQYRQDLLLKALDSPVG